MERLCVHPGPGSRVAQRCPRHAAVRFETSQTTHATRFRPCIDIHKGKVKQIVGSTLHDATQSSLVVNFESMKSAREYATMYREDDLPGGHVIMLGADSSSQQAALEALRAYPGGLQLGGGVNLNNAVMYLDAGASHVIVTSFVFRDGKVDTERLQQLVKLVGKSRLVLDLSCRKKASLLVTQHSLVFILRFSGQEGQYMVVTDRWQKFSDLVINEETLAALSKCCDEFLVHGVDVEGKRLGIDKELVELLKKWSPIRVTYAGGVASMEDLETINVTGGGRVDATIGSALDIFGGNISYRDVVKWHRQYNRTL